MTIPHHLSQRTVSSTAVSGSSSSANVSTPLLQRTLHLKAFASCRHMRTMRLHQSRERQLVEGIQCHQQQQAGTSAYSAATALQSCFWAVICHAAATLFPVRTVTLCQRHSVCCRTGVYHPATTVAGWQRLPAGSNMPLLQRHSPSS